MKDARNTQKSKQKKPLPFYETWGFLIALCIVAPLVLRSLVFTPFHIPSGSMKPTLLIGDYIVASKYAYGYSKYSFPLSPDLFEGRVFDKKPQRGDIIIFRPPATPSIDFIKRLIGLPGDVIQMREGRLYINGVAVERERVEDYIEEGDEDARPRTIIRYRETLPEGISYETLDDNPEGALDNTSPYVVPEGHYFFMGDNRDNSQDSRVQRVVGFVPAENLVGRAEAVVLSTKGKLWKFWEWFSTLRGDRFLTSLQHQ